MRPSGRFPRPGIGTLTGLIRVEITGRSFRARVALGEFCDLFRSGRGSRRVLLCGEGQLVETVAQEIEQACARYGGSWLQREPDEGGTDLGPGSDGDGSYELILGL